MHGPRYVQAFASLYAGSTVAANYFGGMMPKQAIAFTSTTTLLFLTGLYSSLCIYRAIFSPLCRFPGPFGARFSDLYLCFQLGKRDAYRKTLSYHEKYGDYVRIGSNTITIVDPAALNVVYGSGSRCTKSDFYDGGKPVTSMHSTRSRAVHDQRRHIWSAAFSDKALRGYEIRIRKFQDQLVEQISGFNAQPFDAFQWIMYFAYDVMGDQAFGASFEMLGSGKEHWVMKLMKDAMLPVAFKPPIWIFRLLLAIPGLSKDLWRFQDYCGQKLKARMQTKPPVPDIMSALLKVHEAAPPTKDEMNMLQGEAQLIILAGR